MSLTTETMMIRQAQVKDLPNLIGCLTQMVEATGYRILPSQRDPFYAMDWLFEKMHNPNSLFLVAESDGEIIGLCGGSIVPFMMLNDFPHLWEWAWWVRDENDGTARKLWAEMKTWAKAQGAKGCHYGKSVVTSETTLEETLYWRVW